ncbi:MAG: SOS response-associated peptidase family protein [Fimbriimonadaceae bacterium]|nr:SOS response-associated peptidase family protein [Fimbriimonadaceae bacterium]
MCSVIWTLQKSNAEQRRKRPSESAELILPKQQVIDASWGFKESFDDKPKLVINARSETITEKEMFRPYIGFGRAVVRVSKFGDWERYSHKEKLLWEFTPTNAEEFQLACLWRMQDGKPEFVILTTTSNELYERVGDRMPCVLTDQDSALWLGEDTEKALDALHTFPAEGMRAVHEEPLQESLFEI